jgi:hypothetical protein
MSAPTPNSLAAMIALVRRFNQWRRGDETLEMENPTQIGEALDAICDRVELLEGEKDAASTKARLAGNGLADMLVNAGVIDHAALDDPEGYDRGVTLSRLRQVSELIVNGRADPTHA